MFLLLTIVDWLLYGCRCGLLLVVLPLAAMLLWLLCGFGCCRPLCYVVGVCNMFGDVCRGLLCGCRCVLHGLLLLVWSFELCCVGVAVGCCVWPLDAGRCSSLPVVGVCCRVWLCCVVRGSVLVCWRC